MVLTLSSGHPQVIESGILFYPDSKSTYSGRMMNEGKGIRESWPKSS